MPLRIVAVAILHLFKATIRLGNNAVSRERVVPVARYVAQEETSQERNKGERRGLLNRASWGRGACERGALTVRGPHSTDNVTFFNPRFTLFAPPSVARKAQTVKV